MHFSSLLTEHPKTQVTRLRFIHWCVLWSSQVRTRDVQSQFAISRYQANKDISLYAELSTAALKYDAAKRAFVCLGFTASFEETIFAYFDDFHVSNLPIKWYKTGIIETLYPHSTSTLRAIYGAMNECLSIDVSGYLAGGSFRVTKLFPLYMFGVDSKLFVFGIDLITHEHACYPLASLLVHGEAYPSKVRDVKFALRDSCYFTLKPKLSLADSEKAFALSQLAGGQPTPSILGPGYIHSALKDVCGCFLEIETKEVLTGSFDE